MKITFIDENGAEVRPSQIEGALIINFPGGGLNFDDCGGKQETIEQAVRTSAHLRRIINSEKADISSMSIITAVYDRKDESIIADFNKNGKIDSEILSLTDGLIRGRMLDQRGCYLSGDKAVNNLSSLLLVGHCLGAVVVSEIENALINRMKKNKFSFEEIKKQVGAVNCFLSSAPLRVARLPRYFDTQGFWNYSDRTLKGVEMLTGGTIKDIAVLGHFTDKDRFVYCNNPSRWQVPEHYYMKSVRPLERSNCEMVVVNSLEIPYPEEVSANIFERFNLTPTVLNEELGTQMLSSDYRIKQKKIMNGHDWSSILKAPNRESSLFMQRLNHVLWSKLAMQAKKASWQNLQNFPVDRVINSGRSI